MREVKSVKVDNWGVFFLQKLQNFFNKTDYCDLTLQFNDNSQLKVHRLVLSACTDYFNVLEQTCEVIDDILIMPPGLQADVIVPIVNFMYTGTLEFEIDMYGRLLRTARDMNMTVLLKLLEAHKRTVDTSRAQQQRRTPKSFPNRRTAPTPAQQIRVDRTYNTSHSNNYNEPGRTIPVSAHQLRTLQIKPVAPSTSYYTPNAAEPASLVAKYAHSKTPMKGPSRFECNDETTLPPDSFEQFDSISYESKPLITANQASKEDIEDYDTLIPAHDTSSTFEQLRKSYTGSKRPASSVSSFESPPDKKPNIQDVKEYAEQQRMRKQITAEYDDDNEYDEVLDDEFHNDDDDEDYVPPAHLQKSIKKQPGPSAVVIKQEKDQKPTIVVKDTVGSNVNHAKIISEVLKKYPHLVKNNKNIKLKIMAKSSTSPSQPQSIIIKQEPETERPTSIQTQTIQRTAVKAVNTQPMPQKQQNVVQQRIVPAQAPIAIQTITHQQHQQQHLKQPTQNVATSTTIQTQKVPVTTNPAPRRIDSKTMHALIALGAENTTGPWLCLRCGVNGRPISIPSYRGFRRHLINTHKEKVDPRLCEHCGWRSGNDTELYHHMKVQHSIAPPVGYDFPQCPYCPSICLNKAGLEQHLKEDHPDKILYEQHCMYCDGMFKDEDVLFNHMNTQHKAQAQKDGLIDYSDEEESEYYSGDQATDKGIKILSNITISPQAGIEQPASKLGAESLSTVATGIAASLGLIDSSDSQEIQYLEETEFMNAATSKTVQEPKFVNADGQIMDLTPEQRDEIISQLEGQPEGGVVMVLNDSFPSGDAGEADIKMESEDSTGLLGTFEEEKEKEPSENKQHMDWEHKTQSNTTSQTASKTKEDAIQTETEQPEEDPLKPDEDTSAHDESIENDEDQESEQPNENVDPEDKEDEKEKLEKAKEKLKLLAGDWSDDEEDLNDEGAASTKETADSAGGNTEEIESEAKQTETNEHEEIIYETTTGKKTDIDAKATTDTPDKCLTDPKDNDEKAEEDIATDEPAAVDETVASAETEESNKETESKSTTKSHQKDKADSESEKDEANVKSASPKNKPETDTEEKSPKQDDSAKSTADDKKDVDGGDRIRTLISEWGDDEEDL